jgi:hypothetical protein
MGTTAFSTLYAYAQRKYSDRSDDRSITVCKECANRAMKRIAKTDHPYFISRGVINTFDPITSGTIAVANGSTSGTITSGPVWASATAVACSIIIDGEEYHYDIDTYTSTAVKGVEHITFGNSAKWVNDAVTSATFTVYQDIYDLPSGFRTMGKIMEPSALYDVTWVPSVSAWYQLKVLNHSLTGNPRWGCFANGQLRLWPYSETPQVLSFPYYRWPTTMSSDSDTMDFDDNQIELVYRAIELEVGIERNKDVSGKKAEFNECLREMLAAARGAHEIFEIGGGMPAVRPFEYTIGDDVG